MTKTIAVVGVIQRSDLRSLYEAYPQWKEQIQKVNKYMYRKAKGLLSKYVLSQNMEDTYLNQLKAIEQHITYSTENEYKEIVTMLQDPKLQFNTINQRDQNFKYDLIRR